MEEGYEQKKPTTSADSRERPKLLLWFQFMIIEWSTDYFSFGMYENIMLNIYLDRVSENYILLMSSEQAL